MAVKTMSANSGTGKFDDGWHELAIASAVYGVYKATAGDKKYIYAAFGQSLVGTNNVVCTAR